MDANRARLRAVILAASNELLGAGGADGHLARKHGGALDPKPTPASESVLRSGIADNTCSRL